MPRLSACASTCQTAPPSVRCCAAARSSAAVTPTLQPAQKHRSSGIALTNYATSRLEVLCLPQFQAATRAYPRAAAAQEPHPRQSRCQRTPRRSLQPSSASVWRLDTSWAQAPAARGPSCAWLQHHMMLQPRMHHDHACTHVASAQGYCYPWQPRRSPMQSSGYEKDTFCATCDASCGLTARRQ